jgi:hypothetical protein
MSDEAISYYEIEIALVKCASSAPYSAQREAIRMSHKVQCLNQ